MESITRHSWDRATEEAVLLWTLASTQYPLDHRIVQEKATRRVIESVSIFALYARRALEVVHNRPSIELRQPRWQWTPIASGDIVTNLWDALNRIIHAKKLDVGWEKLPPTAAIIDKGAIVICHIRAETDHRPLAFIDPFALAHAFLYDALPLQDLRTVTRAERTH